MTLNIGNNNKLIARILTLFNIRCISISIERYPPKSWFHNPPVIITDSNNIDYPYLDIEVLHDIKKA